MKHRNGFVSNSSSSSFIIGLAEIADKELLKQAFKDCGLDYTKCYGVSIMSSAELVKRADDYYSDTEVMLNHENGESKIRLSSFTGSSIDQNLGKTDDIERAKLDDSLKKEWLVIDYTGNEGDDAFYIGYGDIDYDIDESFFSGSEFEHILNWMNEPGKNGLKNVTYKIGAGRNG